MTGIFPSSGVASAQTINGVASPSVIAGCDPRWYGIKCNVRIDVASMNAIISEILNAVNCAGSTYDCSRLDNLCKSIPLNVRENLCPTLTLTAAAETATILYCASDGKVKKGPIPAVPNICGAPNIGTITTQKIVLCNNGGLELGDLPSAASFDPCTDADDVGTLPANASVLACIGGVLSRGLISGGSGGKIVAWKGTEYTQSAGTVPVLHNFGTVPGYGINVVMVNWDAGKSYMGVWVGDGQGWGAGGVNGWEGIPNIPQGIAGVQNSVSGPVTITYYRPGIRPSGPGGDMAVIFELPV